MELAKHMYQPHHPIQSSGAPAEPSKSIPHMCLIPSSVGDLLAAAAPNKRIFMEWRALHIFLSELTLELPNTNESVISLHHTQHVSP